MRKFFVDLFVKANPNHIVIVIAIIIGFTVSKMVNGQEPPVEEPVLTISQGFRDPIPEDFTSPATSPKEKANAGITDISGEREQWEGEFGRAQYVSDIIVIQTRADAVNTKADGTDVELAVSYEYGVITNHLNQAADKLTGWGFSDCDFCHSMMKGFLEDAIDRRDEGQALEDANQPGANSKYQAAVDALDSAYDWLEARERMESGFTNSTGTYVMGVLDHMIVANSHLETAEMTYSEWEQMQQQQE